MKDCKYCSIERKRSREKLMSNKGNPEFIVLINSCNYLEHSMSGNEDECLFGIEINFCPMCGRKLKKEKKCDSCKFAKNVMKHNETLYCTIHKIVMGFEDYSCFHYEIKQ